MKIINGTGTETENVFLSFSFYITTLAKHKKTSNNKSVPTEKKKTIRQLISFIHND